MKQKKCKICLELFTARNSTQAVCSLECAVKLAANKKEKKEMAEWKEKKKAMINKLETASDKRNKLQKIFNEFIRLRDKGNPCISCNRSLEGKNYHAGHFYAVGQFPELRFNELNCHAQCHWCNIHLHGNGALYRMNLERKIGADKLILLDGLAHVPVKYSAQEIEEMSDFYKDEIKKLKKIYL
jgi:hypothetical protein